MLKLRKLKRNKTRPEEGTATEIAENARTVLFSVKLKQREREANGSNEE